ncbi:MAG: hypothetical protein HY043_03645 [Verrucomicrobia bacterium]|nr:hypothetical protein [Verrucomicrobiota bacterium]
MKQHQTNNTSLLTSYLALLVAFTVGLMPVLSFASGGGTGGGGGGGTVVSAITSFKVTAGYRPGGGASGAVWTSYSVQVPSGTTPIVHLTVADAVTGQYYYNGMVLYYSSATIDADYVPFSTTCVVKLDLLNNSGAVLDSRSATVTTPAPKTQP